MGKENDYFVVLLIWESIIHFFYFCDIFSATNLKDTTLGQKKWKSCSTYPYIFFWWWAIYPHAGFAFFFKIKDISFYIFWIVHVTIYIWVYSKLYNIVIQWFTWLWWCIQAWIEIKYPMCTKKNWTKVYDHWAITSLRVLKCFALYSGFF